MRRGLAPPDGLHTFAHQLMDNDDNSHDGRKRLTAGLHRRTRLYPSAAAKFVLFRKNKWTAETCTLHQALSCVHRN